MNLYNDIKQHIEPTSKILDLGCGIKTYSTFSPNTTTIDAWDKLEPDLLMDLEVEKLPFEDNSFDHITMVDFIEHLDKEAGQELIEDCKRIVRNKLFIFTPLYWSDNSVNVENPRCWAYGNKYDYENNSSTRYTS